MNFLADHLSRIHEGIPGLLDISLKDPTIDYNNLELPDSNQPLQIKQGTPPLPILALNHATQCIIEAKLRPLSLIPAVTLLIILALNTL